MPDDPRQHWESVYRSKADTDVSWYQPHLAQSLELIEGTKLGRDACIIDVGAGTSTLVDDLLDRGYRNLIVNDISESALAVSKSRLGARAATVSWRAGDITTLDLPADTIDLWHDRAVFHFLTNATQRRAYIDRVCCSVRKGGFVILATFGPEGPEKCSGLPVMRYAAGDIHGAFGDAFKMIEHREERHSTPWGSEQEFVYCMCTRESAC